MAVQLAFEAIGDGPPVVILHGLLGSGRNWRSVAKAIAPDHRVYCVDMRNHGQSPWAPSMSYPEMAEDVRMLIESQRLDKPVVIGHSMGGKTAMVLALEAPKLIGRLIVVDIAPVSYPDRFSSYVEAMQAVDTHTLTKRADAMQQVAQRIQDTDVVGFLMQNLVPRDHHFDWRVNLGVIGAQLSVLSGFPQELLARRYQGPTTLIRGSLSDYVQPPDRAVFAQMFPGLQVIDIQGAGHWVHADKPVEFLAALALTRTPAA
jgi:pimeloyl-ACP methyl ester carboxylesterase